jgi:hypothetical protein
MRTYLSCNKGCSEYTKLEIMNNLLNYVDEVTWYKPGTVYNTPKAISVAFIVLTCGRVLNKSYYVGKGQYSEIEYFLARKIPTYLIPTVNGEEMEIFNIDSITLSTQLEWKKRYGIVTKDNRILSLDEIFNTSISNQELLFLLSH